MTRTARLLLVPLAVGALTFASACGDSSDSGSGSTTTTADGGTVYTKSGSIALKVGERATIELEANPSTGYQWDLDADPDGDVVHIVSDHYVAAPTAVVGASGTQTIVIEGVGAGETQLSLSYGRPWEHSAPAAETANFTITVS